MSKLKSYKKCIFIFLFGFSQWVAAKDLALLVGIGNYPDLPPLEGPQYDIAAVAESLERNWAFARENITLLKDDQATKLGILNALDQLYQESQVGDDIFVYFSGHGTSYFDLRLGIPLPHTTGAFVPYDTFTGENGEKLSDKLIIGNRDLLPRLQKFDLGGRHLFVAVDACYAGSTVRSGVSKQGLPTRYVDFSGIGDVLPSRKPETTQTYPYNNIYYLGASSQYEQAVDISSQWLYQYPTIDGNPHGAFTDSLLRVLDNPLAFDKNKSGELTYAELKEGVSELMRARRFNHSPYSLPTLEQDINSLNDNSVFFLDPDRMASQSSLRKSRLNYSDWLANLQSEIEGQALEMQGEIHGRTNDAYAVDGENIGFTVYPEQPGHLMIVNFSSSGRFTLLYPANKEQSKKYWQEATIKKDNFARVGPPFGEEIVYVLMAEQPFELPVSLYGSSSSFQSDNVRSFTRSILKDGVNLRYKKFIFETQPKENFLVDN